MSKSPKTPDTSSNSTSKTSSRKLKQARLPFHVISPDASKPTCKKRKLNNDGDIEIVLEITKNKENDKESTKKEQIENIQDVEMIELDNEKNDKEKDIERKNVEEKNIEGDKNDGEKVIEEKNDGNNDIEENKNDRVKDIKEKNNEEEKEEKNDKIKLDDSLNDKESENDEDLSFEKQDYSIADNSPETKTKKQKSPSENNNDQSLIDSSNDETTEPMKKKVKKTPSKKNHDVSAIDVSSDESSTSDTKTPSKSKKILTPRQIKKRAESAKRKEEREKIRQEKEKERLEKKEKLRLEKEKEKMKIQKLKDIKRIEKEEKEKMKQEKEKKKQELIDAKNEEKKLKEEERLKKEKRQQAAFTSFFLTKNKSLEGTKSSDDDTITPFMPFQIKTDMRLAPKTRIEFKEEMKENFDNIFQKQNVELSGLYLNQLKDQKYIIKKSNKTWPSSELNKEEVALDEQNEIYLIPTHEEEGLVRHLQLSHTEKPPKAKLLLFHENQRPPYWGTWRKPMRSITPKKPFAKEDILDYNVDSDLEWEDEEPGESLQGSEDDKESEDEYEVDNEFFVPHGYLSDGENENEEDCVETTENKETCKEERLHKMEIDFDKEMRMKTTRIQPTIIGCLWREDLKNPKISTQLKSMIMSRCALFDQTLPIDVIPIEINHTLTNSPTQSPSTEKKFQELDDEDIKNLIRLVQRNPNSRRFLVEEFSNFWTNECQKSGKLSKRQIFLKIKEIAEWKMNNLDGNFKGRLCWMVKPDILESYNFNEQINDLSWNYKLKPKISQDCLVEMNVEAAIINTPKDNIPLITKFTKVLTKEEKEKQILSKKENISTNQNSDCDIILVKENITNETKPKHSSVIVVDEKDNINNKSTSTTTPSSLSSKLKPKLSGFLFKSAKK